MQKRSFLILLSLMAYGRLLQAQDFVFSRADGFKLLIYDNNVEPEKNRLLSMYNNIDYVIDGNGEVQFGAFGKIRMAGLSLERATQAIYDRLQPFGKDLTVVLVPQIRLIVRGEVGKPGMYRLSPNLSFWDLLEQAGGVSSSFSLENMYVIRNGDVVYAKFMDALYMGTSLKELGLQSGDELIAPRINRISFAAVMRYVNFFSSLFFLYYAITNMNNKNN